eukprot:GEMP01144379.1.p1 GENE.GEMP01144379.1~~GEMP01144379.1.p1  ORF type:complete len:123 (+),score=26.35 GEMP01144379.1:27-371(+)
MADFVAPRGPYRLEHGSVLALVPAYLRKKIGKILRHYEQQLRVQEKELKWSNDLCQILHQELQETKRLLKEKSVQIEMLREASQSALHALDVQTQAVDDIFGGSPNIAGTRSIK